MDWDNHLNTTIFDEPEYQIGDKVLFNVVDATTVLTIVGIRSRYYIVQSPGGNIFYLEPEEIKPVEE